MPDLKTGPLTRDDLLDIWRGAVDKSYRDPIEQAGDGQGFEVPGQAAEQLARASRAIDLTTQAMFICPWSGQTNDPASGAAKATVTLTFARTRRFEEPLVLSKGFITTEHETTDYNTGSGVPITVRTGRRYVLTEDLVFHPGDQGPFTALAQAERPGHGYNNPLPGTLSVITQIGADFTNDLATVSVVGPGSPVLGAISTQVFVQTPNEADTYVPEHLGQYTLMVAGTNVGKVGRVVSFTPPDLTVSPALGSKVQLAYEQSLSAAVFAGTFTVGEDLEFKNGVTIVAYGKLLGERTVGGKKKITYLLLSGGGITTATTVLGLLSAATATLETFLFPQAFVVEAATAQWRMLDWAQDYGLTVTNVLSPAGGKLAMLDELGNERAIHRAPGEEDASYRLRIKEIADVVTPNAIRRTLARIMGALPYCFREVGSSRMPGFYYDGDESPTGGSKTTSLTAANLIDAYDTDTIRFIGAGFGGTFFDNERVVYEDPATDTIYAEGFLSPNGFSGGGPWTLIMVRKKGAAVAAATSSWQVRGVTSGAILSALNSGAGGSVTAFPANDRRFRFNLDYTEFRAFFCIGVPRLAAGEFGFAYDSYPWGAYDAAPFTAFYDGFAYLAALFYRNIYNAIEAIKAGGVGLHMMIEDIGCP